MRGLASCELNRAGEGEKHAGQKPRGSPEL
jgi:hypothetical protein